MHIQEPPELLIHQPSVDCYDSSGQLFSAPDYDAGSNELDHLPPDHLLATSLREVINLKTAAGTKSDRAYDIASRQPDFSAIKPERRRAFELAQDIASHASSKDIVFGWYSLADVTATMDSAPAPYTLMSGSTHSGEPLYTRLEESLIVKAEQVVRALQFRVKGRTGKYSIEGDSLIKHRGPGDTVPYPLHGYEFNRNAQDATQRKRIDALPSCEAFIAATALEQVELAPSVIRVIPFWMKDRELLARDMLRLIGHADLPIVSLVTGKSGDVERIIRWGTNQPPALPSLDTYIRSRFAHRTSANLAKSIHDTLFAEHTRLYEARCHTSSPHNYPPATLLNQDLVTTRAHEFLSRTWWAAPLFESNGHAHTGERDESRVVFSVLRELLGRNYQMKPLSSPKQSISHKGFKGKNTNDVLYVHGIFSSRPEEDPVALPGSDQIDFVGHLVFEHAQEVQDIFRNKRLSPAEATLQAMGVRQPRYTLFEARRTGEALGRSTPVL